ncbi:MAG: amidohydrolase family protein [Planctomycetota bacterium]|nr:amidohydrolase family protein [Planctomycetota bacterium]
MRIDCHSHCSLAGPINPDRIVEDARRLGIDKVCCSHGPGDPVTPERLRSTNNQILAAMRMYPDVILGQCFVNPGYARFTQDEITRCVVDGGMIGLKVYYQYFMNEPVFYPVLERCAELGVPILMHAGHLTDPSEAARQPRISGAEHFIEPGKLFPETDFMIGHIGGGGDWEWQIKAMRQAPKNVYMDTSGSVIDAGMIEKAVRDLGAERLLFATDLSTERGVGKILDADITQRQKEMIWSENFQQILKKRKV